MKVWCRVIDLVSQGLLVVLIACLLLISALAQVNLWKPYLRLDNVRLNYMSMLLLLSLPVVCIILAFRFPPGIVRLFCVSASAPVALWAAWPLLWAFVLTPIVLLRGTDPSFERIHETRVGVYRIAAFRADHGGMTSFNIAIRQERVVLPGLLVVKAIGGAGATHDAQVHVIDPRRVEVEYAWYPEGKLAWGRREILEIDENL